MEDDVVRRWRQSCTRQSAPADPPWLEAGWLDVERERLEAGPGGDVDADGRLTRTGRSYVPGLKRTVSQWLRLYERVQQGDLGGAHDGAPFILVARAEAPEFLRAS